MLFHKFQKVCKICKFPTLKQINMYVLTGCVTQAFKGPIFYTFLGFELMYWYP